MSSNRAYFPSYSFVGLIVGAAPVGYERDYTNTPDIHIAKPFLAA